MPQPQTMHEVTDWQHSHDYRIDAQHHAERRTRWVIALTAITMVVELIAGTLTGSMALLADGWHMAGIWRSMWGR
jgi:Co/Zn/Cd efflux system component